MIDLMLPGFVNHNDKYGQYYVFQIEWGIIEEYSEFKGEYQFIFEEIGDNEYKMIMNGGEVEKIDLEWSAQSAHEEAMELYGSIIVNHPLIGKTLKELYVY